MPEGYTHVRTARKAAAAVRYKVKWPAAFDAGANGPDIFFCYEAWRSAAKRRWDLPALGSRMHEDNTGAFLQSLVRNVKTGPQVEYVLGFLSHYAADTVLHPYVAAVCQPGMPYGEKGGHGYFEIALDSTLHKEDTGDAAVPAVEACPTPAGEALADVVALLHTALLETYELDIPIEYLADSFYYSTKLRGLFISRLGVKKGLFWLLEPLFGGRGKITGHVSPRRLKESLPEIWTDPYSGEARTGDVFTLLAQAQALSEQYMAAAILVWNGRQPMDLLAQSLGSSSYTQGRPTPESAPGGLLPPQTPPEEPTPAPEPEPPAEPEEAPPVRLRPKAQPPEPACPEPDPSEAAPPPLPENEDALLAEGLALIQAARESGVPDTTEPPEFPAFTPY